jgi:aminopeptidase YwaD
VTDAARRLPSIQMTVLAAVGAVVLLVGCSGDASATAARPTPSTTTAPTEAGTSVPGAPSVSPTSSPTPVATATAEHQGMDTPDVARVLTHIDYLASTIGSRPAGSAQEREAAQYIAGVLTDAGYDVHLEEFQFDATIDDSEVGLPGATPMEAIAMQPGPTLEATGLSVFGGLGSAEDLAGLAVAGRVVIYDRGTVTFRDKVVAAEAAGAVGVIVINERAGLFRGSLGDYRTSIPVVGVGGEDRDALLAAVGTSVTVTAIAGSQSQNSQNVVASVDGGECEGYLGAHYDSVPQGPGANDNASGIAVVMELARVNKRDGLCVIAFGAEELGLFGSRDYVAHHLAGGATFMLNVDMAGRLDGPIIVGDSTLTSTILEAIADAGVSSSFRRGTFPPFASSDHVSFQAVGLPSVTFNSGDDIAIHTPEDDLDRIDEGALSMFLDSVGTALGVLLPERQPAGVR